MMIKTSLIATTLAIASLASVVTPAVAQVTYSVQVAPPPPRAERIPAPRRGMAWVPGHWEHRGRGYVWAGGYWVKARPGYAYNAPVWEQRDGRWGMRRGGWERGPNGDRDRDGVPNKFDARPGDPNRR